MPSHQRPATAAAPRSSSSRDAVEQLRESLADANKKLNHAIEDRDKWMALSQRHTQELRQARAHAQALSGDNDRLRRDLRLALEDLSQLRRDSGAWARQYDALRKRHDALHSRLQHEQHELHEQHAQHARQHHQEHHRGGSWDPPSPRPTSQRLARGPADPRSRSHAAARTSVTPPPPQSAASALLRVSAMPDRRRTSFGPTYGDSREQRLYPTS